MAFNPYRSSFGQRFADLTESTGSENELA